MEDFISYSKIAELLTKALRDELTDEEREVLERWRHEASVHEAFYRRVNTPEFLEEHPQHRFEGEIAEAWGRLYVRHRSRRRRLVAIRWSVAAMVAIVLGGVALWQSGGEAGVGEWEDGEVGGACAAAFVGSGWCGDQDG